MFAGFGKTDITRQLVHSRGWDDCASVGVTCGHSTMCASSPKLKFLFIYNHDYFTLLRCYWKLIKVENATWCKFMFPSCTQINTRLKQYTCHCSCISQLTFTVLFSTLNTCGRRCYEPVHWLWAAFTPFIHVLSSLCLGVLQLVFPHVSQNFHTKTKRNPPPQTASCVLLILLKMQGRTTGHWWCGDVCSEALYADLNIKTNMQAYLFYFF